MDFRIVYVVENLDHGGRLEQCHWLLRCRIGPGDLGGSAFFGGGRWVKRHAERGNASSS